MFLSSRAPCSNMCPLFPAHCPLLCKLYIYNCQSPHICCLCVIINYKNYIKTIITQLYLISVIEATGPIVIKQWPAKAQQMQEKAFFKLRRSKIF